MYLKIIFLFLFLFIYENELKPIPTSDMIDPDTFETLKNKASASTSNNLSARFRPNVVVENRQIFIVPCHRGYTLINNKCEELFK